MGKAKKIGKELFEELKGVKKGTEEDMYKEIRVLFQHFLYRKNTATFEGLSKEDILQHFFGVQFYSEEKRKLITKLIQRYKKEQPALISLPNNAGEYVYGFPNDSETYDRHMVRRNSAIIGNIKGAINSAKAMSIRLPEKDWVTEAMKLISSLSNESKVYIEDKTRGN